MSAPLASVFAAGCDATLAVLQAVVAAAADVPAGHFWVAGPAWWWVVGWYAILGATAVWGRRDLVRRPATWATLAAGWCGVGLLAAAIGLRFVHERDEIRLDRPALPAFLEAVELHGLRAGHCEADVLLRRHAIDVGVTVLRRSGPVNVVTVS